MTNERWLPVVGYETTYEVSNLGRVRRIGAAKGTVPGKIRKLVPRNGYLQVILSQRNRVELCWVHRLVAMAFLGVPPVGVRFEVNHIDGDRANNTVANLEWITHAGNCLHAYRVLGREPAPSKGSRNGFARLTETDVREIRRATGASHIVAARYGVSGSSIRNIRSGRTWGHVR